MVRQVGRSPCRVDGCGLPVRGRGLCNTHRARLVRYGDVRAGDPIRPLNLPIIDRIMAHVEKTDDGCWTWTGGLNDKGYAVLNIGQTPRRVHRLIYAEVVGTIPKGKIIRHTCDNPPCVNPEHLLVGTQADNINDMIQRGRAAFQHKE